ncbi:MAG: tyrosine-type recombinase/integrase, partial [Spirochaetaceae bacterium]|nr:tyrosine-type recombinase/integrase [Spirochaetaceae bacterium]
GNRLCTKYRKSIRRSQAYFFSWMKESCLCDIRGIKKKDLLAYQKVLCGETSKATGLPLSAGVLNDRYHVVRMLFSILYRHGLVEENPAYGLGLDVVKKDQRKRRAMSRAEITHFLESLDVKTAKGIRDRALFELIYSSGLRVSEAAGLKAGDIDIENRQMIVRGKFGTDRMVPLSKVAKDFLLVYLGKRIQYPEESVFLGKCGAIKAESISRCFRELLKELDMNRPDISTHSIRHSTATHLSV